MKQQQQLYSILKHFDGMSKLGAFDLLHKIEVLLFYAKSPLEHREIKDNIESNMDVDNSDIKPFQFTILPNGNFGELMGSNDWIRVYKEVRRGIGRLSPFARYYYKTKYAPLELLRLTNDNILDSVSNTDHEPSIFTFLNHHSVTKKDAKTNQLLLLGI